MESEKCYYCGKKLTKHSEFYNLDNKGHKICRSCLQQGYAKSALEIIEHNENVDKRREFMNSEKVKEIKEKLKERYYYLDQAYSDHLAYGGKADEQQEEEIYFLGDIRTLINELESENERLSKELDSEWKDRRKAEEDLHKAQWNYKIGLSQSQKRNQQLKDRIAELEKEKTCVWKEWTDGDNSIWCCSNCKEDFCFIECDVYENNYGYCPHCGAKITALKELKEDDIDETLKEFIER